LISNNKSDVYYDITFKIIHDYIDLCILGIE